MKRQQRSISMVLVVILLGQPFHLMAKQGSSSFKEIKQEKYEEDQLHFYEHPASGLQLIWIENQDVNKAFALGVRTPTVDDTGVNHIIEHTLFTGSEHYPSPSLFFDANEAYPATYMNALTSGDMTIFPFATPYDACYDALLSIYLDAIFKPNLLKQPYGFYEEGFHYVPDQHRTGGVVYNEMKGAYDNIDRTVYRQIRKMIFKDTHYAYDSGGKPDAIPSLTYEDCVATYKRYYYPGNMKIILYGDLEIEKILTTIQNYLQEEQMPRPAVDLGVKTLNQEGGAVYHILPMRDKNYLVKAFALQSNISCKALQELDLWMMAYLMGPQSCLQQALEKQGYEAKWLKDDDVPYPVYALMIQGVPEDKLEACSAYVDMLLKKVALTLQKNIFLEQDMLKETKWLFEKQDESNNRGITIAQSILDGWAHGREENQYFINKDQLRKMTSLNLKAGSLLLSQAKEYTLFLMPQEEKVVERPTSTFSDDEWQKLHQEMNRWQQTKMPLKPVELEKLMTGMDTQPIITKKEDYWTMATYLPTHLARSQIYLNTSHIPQKDLKYLFLYTYLLEESARDISPFSGSLNTSCSAYPLKEGYWPCFRLSITTLPEETQHGVLFNEARQRLLSCSEQWYQQKLRELVHNMKANSQNNAIGTLASLSMAGQDDRSSYLYEAGYPFYWYCQELGKLPNTSWIEEVKKIDSQLYHQGGLILATTCSQKGKNPYQASWEKTISHFKKLPNYKSSYVIKVPQGNCFVPAETKIDYSFKALYKPEGIEGIDYLITAYLTKNHLNAHLRIEQGAYGAGCQVYDLKTMGMYAYRTPNYKEALVVMDESSDCLQHVDPDLLEQSKAQALSRVHNQFRLLGTPIEKAVAAEHLILWGRSPHDILSLQQDILNATPEKVAGQKENYEKLISCGKSAVMTSKNLDRKQNFTIYYY